MESTAATQLVKVTGFESCEQPPAEITGANWYQALEQGNILLLPEGMPGLDEETREFLLGQRQSESSLHKNIAYRPNEDRLTGVARATADVERLRQTLRWYSQTVVTVVRRMLPRYAEGWRLDYASFRPIEEEGRELPLRARNDLVHVDSFPTRPNHGDRILRVFTNIHPNRPRVWMTGPPFEQLARDHAEAAGLGAVVRQSQSGRYRLIRAARRIASPAVRRAGLRLVDPSPYDRFMLGFHHYLKANADRIAESTLSRFILAPCGRCV